MTPQQSIPLLSWDARVGQRVDRFAAHGVPQLIWLITRTVFPTDGLCYARDVFVCLGAHADKRPDPDDRE
jgi:hypothetical protein